MRYPGLLAADLTERERLKPMSGSLTVKLVGASDAEMTLPEDGPAIQIHDLVSLYTEKGFAGVFRVTNVAQNYKKQIDVSLLHGIDLLSDSVWAAQTDFEGTRAQYITAILDQQTTLINGVKPWVLGTCHDTETVKKAINYDRLSDLMEEMEEDGGDYYFTYDFTTWPWTVNYLEKPQNAVCEFRLARNVRTATTTYNDADLCTRLHLAVNVEKTVGEGDNATTETETKIKTYNNTEAQAVWGIVVKAADIDTGDDLTQETLPEADAWAAAFMARRREPSVQIQIDGDELKAITGDTWDEYSVGKKCQVALPDYGRTFVERVVSVTYPDLYKDPGHVTVSLANNLPKFSEGLTDARKKADQAKKKATSVGRGAAKAKDLTTWSQIVSYQGAALDGSGVMTLWQSGIDMDAQGGVRIFSLQEGLQSLYAGIEVTASQIRAEVSAGLSGMHSELLMTASQIKAEVDDSLSGIATFIIEADQIRAEVKDALSNLAVLVVEASQIRAEVQGALSDYAAFKIEASQIRAEVSDALSRVATLEITSSQIRAEVSEALSSIASFVIDASQIRSEVYDALSNVASFVVEASQIRTEVRNSMSQMAQFIVTASQIRTEVSNALSQVSTLVIEADQVKTEVQDALSNVATLLVEASQIKAEVRDALSSVSSLVVTASQIKSEVQNALSQAASFVVEASQIRAAVSDAESRIASLEIAASAINISVSNAQSRLGAVEVQAGRVAMVVGSDNKIKAGVIVDAINDTSTALISADRITLDGTTTVSGVLNISGGTMVVSKLANFSEDVTITSGKTLSVGNIQFVGSQQGERYSLTGSNVGNLITELQVASSNNVYYLQKKTVYNSATWTDVASFNRGSAAEISGAWSGAIYTATASGATPVTTTVGMTGAGQQDSFTVSAFHDGVTTNTVNSINGFLVVTSSSTKANNKAEVRLIAKTGVSSVLVSSVGLGDVFDAGAAAVTLSEAWSNNKYTVTASNSKTKSVTIGVTASGSGASNFSIAAYTGAATNTIRSDYVYLVENASQKRVEAHLSTSGGTTVGQVSTSATYNAGKADVTLSEAWNGNKYTVTASNGKTKSVSIGMTGNGQGDSFTVSAYKNSTTTDTANSISGYLVVTSSSTRANNKVEARLGARSGTGSILVGSVTLGDVYDAGKNAVTISGSWAYDDTGVFTYTASNSATKTTTIHLTTKRMGDGNTSIEHFPIWVYNGSSTANNIIERSIYLTEEVSTARSNCRVLAHWNSEGGNTYGRVFTTGTWDAGANAVTLSDAWSNNKYTVTASNSKTKSVTIGMTGNGKNDSFTVSAYYGSSTSNTVKSINGYLVVTSSSTRANNKAEVRLGAKTGSSSILVSSVTLGDVYDKGAAGVTLSDAWSNNKYTVTASNSKTKSVTIGMTGNGKNDSFTVSAYYGSSTSNTVKSINGYLVVTSSSTRADNKAEVRLNAKTGSSSVLVGSVSLGDVFDKGYAVTTSDIQLGNRKNEGTTAPSGTRIDAQNFGIPSSGYGYYSFTITCHGTTKKYYFPYDMR